MLGVDVLPRDDAYAPATRSRLEDLYARAWPDALRLAYLLTGDRSAAEDLVHDAFVKIAGRFGHLRSAHADGAYLRRIVVNLHTSRLRRLRIERRYLASRRGGLPTADQPDVSGRQDLWRALGRLPARQRAALVLRYYEDLPEREAAEVMRCSVPAVRSLVRRGVETLRTREEEWRA